MRNREYRVSSESSCRPRRISQRAGGPRRLAATYSSTTSSGGNQMNKTWLFSSLAIVMSLVAAEPALSQIQKAKVTGGEVQGVVADTVASFKGIPFAAPPVGDFRWKAPQAVTPW